MLLATVGVLSLLLRGDLPGFVMPVIAGAVFLALAPGLYFHNGVARFLAPPLAVPMAFVALIVMTGDDPAGSLVGLAVLSASVVVIVAVATTADRSSLLSS